jgi:hypothetical protein
MLRGRAIVTLGSLPQGGPSADTAALEVDRRAGDRKR